MIITQYVAVHNRKKNVRCYFGEYVTIELK